MDASDNYWFQSTHLHEVWLQLYCEHPVILVFQSTHLHEVWLSLIWLAKLANCFNPHTYMRCDSFNLILSIDIKVSIHTPTWGVTEPPDACAESGAVSIHTPTWGVTFHCITSVLHFVVSIHTPTWGVTLMRVCVDRSLFVSIHTPTWGVTILVSIFPFHFLFQSTHLHEVWHPGGWKKNASRHVSIHTPTWGVT